MHPRGPDGASEGRPLATILIIEDVESHRQQIVETVATSRLFDTLLQARDGLEGLRLLLSYEVDVVLCDLELPGLDGEKLLRVSRERSGDEVPFLFLSANADTRRRVRLLESGACDTLSKPFDSAELVARLRLHLKLKRLQDELREKNETLAQLSTTDGLTGVRSRRYVDEALSIEFLRARRYGQPLTLAMADLDHFKSVNDRYGHAAGDAVLRGVADLLRERLRASDVAGRYGGEEFIVILPQNDVEGAMVFAERWREDVEAARFESPDGEVIPVTLSVGLAAYGPAIETPEALLRKADQALYAAKAAGRNRVVAA
jgi:diguanylate cyclase (GGDEF)-like protein